jgi:UDP-N-acetylglucosamine:LPS N-acetylglucosamine transferase
MSRRALILSGSLGMGHDVIAELLTTTLENQGWQCRSLDCMKLLGGVQSDIADRVFRGLTSVQSVYDSLHFSHFRPGSRLAMAMDWGATRRLVPALQAELGADGADLLISAFPTGASAAAQLKRRSPGLTTVVLCTDASVHRFWAWPEIDLYLVTSEAAAASVRRYVPRARTALVPPPVRRAFYHAGSQPVVRRDLGLPEDRRCVLVMGGGWGLGPLAEVTEALARKQVHVLAVAGRNQRLETRLRGLAHGNAFIHPYGYTDQVPALMAAADLVVTTPGATTCGEARVVGRMLVLLDVVPGHGRENLQHELELGRAEACDGRPDRAVASVLAALDRTDRPAPAATRSPAEWDQAFGAAMRKIEGRADVSRPDADAGALRVATQGAGLGHDGARDKRHSSTSTGVRPVSGVGRLVTRAGRSGS